MLPTPSTFHVDTNRVYEPAEDSFLLLDTLSSHTETAFLKDRFHLNQASSNGSPTPAPLVLEVGTGSGVVLAFLTANASTIFGSNHVLTIGTDVNQFACRATEETVSIACKERISDSGRSEDARSKDHAARTTAGTFLSALVGNLGSPLRSQLVDVLIFNPPYVPSPDVPIMLAQAGHEEDGETAEASRFERDSRLLALSYAGGIDGMEVTNQLLAQLPDILEPKRGVAYILQCKQNKPEDVMNRIKSWDGGWRAEIVGRSGKTAGWEKLIILRIARGKEPVWEGCLGN